MIRILPLILLAGAAGIGLLWRFAPRPSILAISSDNTYFPTVSGFNLDRQEFVFPGDLAGELNILFIPFLQQQQAVVNTWIPFAQESEAAFPGVVYYELPTIEEMPALSRLFVNEGMRAGIPDPTARERTITLYIDTQRFREALDIPGKNEVHVLLVDREGEILWRTSGSFSEEKGQELLDAIRTTR
mgnify:CR=1 FL=1